MSRNNFSSDNHTTLLKIEATGSPYLPYILGIIFGLILIVITVIIDFRFSTMYYYLVLMAIIFYLIIDHGYRQRNNIRMIELDDKSIHIYKGRKMNRETILLSRVTDIYMKKRFLSVSLKLKLHETGNTKSSAYLISSDQIRNAALMSLYNEVKRLLNVK